MNPQPNQRPSIQVPPPEEQPDVERLDHDGREPIEEEHPETPFSVVAISYLVVLFVCVIGATAIVAVYNALT